MQALVKISDRDSKAVIYRGPYDGFLDAMVDEFGCDDPEWDNRMRLSIRDFFHRFCDGLPTDAYESFFNVDVETVVDDDFC